MNWKIGKSESSTIREIAQRAHGMNQSRPLMEIEMDLTATHLNGCPLNLSELAGAPAFDFAHDVFGIAQHLDRNTGQLMDCFVPRYAAKQAA